jgi:hypothetical protein
MRPHPGRPPIGTLRFAECMVWLYDDKQHSEPNIDPG